PTPNACFGVVCPRRSRLTEAVLGQEVELHVRGARAKLLLIGFGAGSIRPVERTPAPGAAIDDVFRPEGEGRAAALPVFGEGAEPRGDALRPIELVQPIRRVSGVTAQFHTPGEGRQI